jgi:hypothetical protein
VFAREAAKEHDRTSDHALLLVLLALVIAFVARDTRGDGLDAYAIQLAAYEIQVDGGRPAPQPDDALGWWPDDFRAYVADDNVAFRFKKHVECDVADRCKGVVVLTKGGCPHSLSVEAALVDDNGRTIGFVNDTTGAIWEGHTFELILEIFDEDAHSVRLTEISCV